MAQPSNATVTIEGHSFNAMSVHVGLETHHDDTGFPMMGSVKTTFSALVDIHDTVNMPFPNLKRLFELANVVNREKVVPMKITFWQDDAKQDAIASFSFDGWLSGYHIDGGGGGNHVLNLPLSPTLDAKQFMDLQMGN